MQRSRTAQIVIGLFGTALALLIAWPAQALEPPQADLPSVDEILQRHIAALGGEEALRRHRHRTLIGTLRIPKLEIQGSLRILASAPDLFLMEADLGEHGVNRTGYNGSTGWTTDEINGPVLLKEAGLAELRRQADFYADLNVRNHYKRIELVGTTKFHEIAAYELKMVDSSDKDVFAYFSIDSGLQVGLKGMPESSNGSVPAETLFADYEHFDGVRLPTRYETHFRDIVQHITITRVEHDVIDEEAFAVPPAVQALQDEQPAKDREPDAQQVVEVVDVTTS